MCQVEVEGIFVDSTSVIWILFAYGLLRGWWSGKTGDGEFEDGALIGLFAFRQHEIEVF